MLNVEQNRRVRKYSSGDIIRRVLWMFAQPLFRFSPRPCFGWRRFVLRCFGAKIGRSVHVYPSATIYFPWNLEAGDESAIAEHAFIYNLGRVTLGARVTISHRAHLCAGTHDHTKADFPLLRPPIHAGQRRHRLEQGRFQCAYNQWHLRPPNVCNRVQNDNDDPEWPRHFAGRHAPLPVHTTQGSHRAHEIRQLRQIVLDWGQGRASSGSCRNARVFAIVNFSSSNVRFACTKAQTCKSDI